MVEFLKTLAIACIPAIITGIVTYIVARKNAASQISIIKEQNKHDLEKLMEQHKVDIEHLKEAHRLDMEAKEQDHNTIVITEKLNTHDHGHMYHQKVGKIGMEIGMEYSYMNTIIRKLFDRNFTYSRKILAMEPREVYAFVINNADLLRHTVREAMAAELQQLTLDISQVSKVPFHIPQSCLFTYDGTAKTQLEMKKNVYQGYLSSAEVRSSSERKFEKFCEKCDTVNWVYKNGDKGNEYLSIVYADNSDKQKNFYAMSRFRKVYQKKNILSSKSRLDITDDKMDEKYEEYKEAIKTGEFSDEYNLTNKDLEKLKSDSVTTVVPTLLDMMFTGADFVLPNAVAKEVYEDFQCLYKQYLGRELTAAEKYVFDSAIKIMIWKVHGKTFSKICQERYAYVSNVAQRRFLAKAGQQNRADNLPVRYIAGYSDIPDKELRAYPLFPVWTKGKDVDYDRIVYDTYDFLDKLIGFKLSDLFYAIFHQYYLAYQDNRAERLAKYIKYGTEDSTEIWMLRYGFSFEEIEWLKPCVESIDQTEIRFNGEIESLDDFQRSSIAQYLF